MRPSQVLRSNGFPCTDVDHNGFQIPRISIDPQAVQIVMVSESTPSEPSDYYNARGKPLFAVTTLQAFEDSGAGVLSIRELIDQGVYLTTAVKCSKTGYGIQSATITQCSRLLETELSVFTNVKAFLLMGDVAIKAFNASAKRNGENRVIPAGSTYKIRGQAYFYHGARVFPSYLQAGPSFFIEKTKRKMIAEDIAAAWSLRI